MKIFKSFVLLSFLYSTQMIQSKELNFKRNNDNLVNTESFFEPFKDIIELVKKKHNISSESSAIDILENFEKICNIVFQEDLLEIQNKGLELFKSLASRFNTKGFKLGFKILPLPSHHRSPRILGESVNEVSMFDFFCDSRCVEFTDKLDSKLQSEFIEVMFTTFTLNTKLESLFNLILKEDKAIFEKLKLHFSESNYQFDDFSGCISISLE